MDLENKVLGVLNKAIHSDPASGHNIRQYIKEDLEIEAHNQLYAEDDPQEMVMLKILPRTMAKQTLHDFTRITEYGNIHSEAGFDERGLPPVNDFDGERDQVKLRPFGTVTQVTGLAELEETISVMGKTRPSAQSEIMARLNFLYKMNKNIYDSDSRLTHNPYKLDGILQQIDEKTRATGATSPDSEFIVDLRGGNIEIDNANYGLRAKSQMVSSKYHGKLRWLVMAGSQRQQLEGQIDDKQRLFLQTQAKKNENMMLGQTLSGITTDSGDMMFATDNILSKHVRCGVANVKLIDGAPSAFSHADSGTIAGTFTATGVASTAYPTISSKWQGIDCRDENGLGANKLRIVYHVEALNEKGASVRGVSRAIEIDPEGFGELKIYPRGGETSFKIYRGIVKTSVAVGSVPTSDTDYLFKPEYIAEIKNGDSKENTTVITFVDDNELIAGTTTAFGLNILSSSSLDFAKRQVPTNLRSEAIGTNAFALVQLTNLFKFDLAKVNWLADYSLYAWVLGLELTRPYHNVVYVNCGRKQVVTGVY